MLVVFSHIWLLSKLSLLFIGFVGGVLFCLSFSVIFLCLLFFDESEALPYFRAFFRRLILF
jgi:hypothetical protein